MHKEIEMIRFDYEYLIKILNPLDRNLIRVFHII